MGSYLTGDEVDEGETRMTQYPLVGRTEGRGYRADVEEATAIARTVKENHC